MTEYPSSRETCMSVWGVTARGVGIGPHEVLKTERHHSQIETYKKVPLSILKPNYRMYLTIHVTDSVLMPR